MEETLRVSFMSNAYHLIAKALQDLFSCEDVIGLVLSFLRDVIYVQFDVDMYQIPIWFASGNEHLQVSAEDPFLAKSKRANLFPQRLPLQNLQCLQTSDKLCFTEPTPFELPKFVCTRNKMIYVPPCKRQDEYGRCFMGCFGDKLYAHRFFDRNVSNDDEEWHIDRFHVIEDTMWQEVDTFYHSGPMLQRIICMTEHATIFECEDVKQVVVVDRSYTRHIPVCDDPNCFGAPNAVGCFLPESTNLCILISIHDNQFYFHVIDIYLRKPIVKRCCTASRTVHSTYQTSIHPYCAFDPPVNFGDVLIPQQNQMDGTNLQKVLALAINHSH